MRKDYLTEAENKKRATGNAMWVLLFFIIIFVAIIIRIGLRSGSTGSLFSSLPSDGDAYEIAKDYIKPTLRTPETTFAEDDYQCIKPSDSVYEVRSYFESTFSSNEKVKTPFAITLKYNGGTISNQQNWSVINMEEH